MPVDGFDDLEPKDSQAPYPSFDLGFNVPETMDIEAAIGAAIVPYDDVHEDITNQLNTHLMRLDTTQKMISSDITGQMYKVIDQNRQLLSGVQNAIETQLAGYLAGPVEIAATLFPQAYGQPTQFDSQTSKIIAGGVTPIIPGGVGSFPIIGGVVGSSINWSPASGKCALITKLGLALIIEGATPPPNSGMPATTNFVGSDGKKYRVAYAYRPSGPNRWVLSIQIKEEFDTSDWNLQPPWECMTNAPPTTIPPISPPVSPPIYPIPPDGTYPCPPCPIPPPCPPPPPRDCIKICPTEEKPCVEKEYDVYCDKTKGTLTVVEKGTSVSGSLGKPVASGTAASINWKEIALSCETKETKPKPEQPPIIPVQFGQGVGCDDIFKFSVAQNPDQFKFFEQIFGLSADPGFTSMPEPRGVGEGIVQYAIRSFGQGILGVINNSVSSSIRLADLLSCTGGGNPQLKATQFILEFANRWLGNGLQGVSVPVNYAVNASCPYLLPTADEAVRAYLTNSMDYDRASCIIKANGYRMDVYDEIIDSARARLSPGETVAAYRRGYITQNDASTNLRELGYLYPVEQDTLYKLSEQIPTISDLVPMMVRDTADEINVNWSKSDEIFEQKWTGQLKKWGEQQGIAPDFMKYVWRAHWRLPSPTQLFEFWKRLRHDPQYGGPDKFRQRIEQTLIQQDILPDWVSSFMEVSYNPITRTDARRAYEIGAVDEDTLRDAFIDSGYSDKNAQILVDFQNKQLQQKWNRSPLISRYVSGELSEQDAIKEARLIGLTDAYVSVFREALNRNIVYSRRKKCLTSWKRRYMIGEFTEQDVKTRLLGEKLDGWQIQELVSSWTCERDNRGLEIPARRLVEWFTLGILDQTELYRRLCNLGYNDDSASKVVVEAKTRLGIKTAAEEQRRLAQQKREQRQREADQKALMREVARSEREKISQADRMRKLKEKRDKLLIEAADKWSKTTGFPLADAVVGIRKIVRNLISAGLSTIDNIYAGAVEVADDPAVLTLDDFSLALGELMTAVET